MPPSLPTGCIYVIAGRSLTVCEPTHQDEQGWLLPVEFKLHKDLIQHESKSRTPELTLQLRRLPGRCCEEVECIQSAGFDSASPDPETFPAEYVRELREENAKSRTKAKRADDLAARLVTSLAAGTGRLADPSDLPVTEALMDDDGMPDEAKLLAAVDELLTRKPHLAATRPVATWDRESEGARRPPSRWQTCSGLVRADGADRAERGP